MFSCETRRGFFAWLLATAGALWPRKRATAQTSDIPAFLQRNPGVTLGQVLGWANEFKEGDVASGVAAADDAAREQARALLANTRIADLVSRPVFEDSLSEYIATAVDREAAQRVNPLTVGELKQFLLTRDDAAIRGILPGLHSDVIGCVVKLMSNDELITASRKIFNPLPGSRIGAEGYMGARIQPNSPTDNVEDIRWQVFDGFAYAVGDVVLGTNPVSSDVDSVSAVEETLLDILRTFGLEDSMPHCVLAHIDVQAAAEKRKPGTTGVWFQSLAGVADANATFDISVEKMRAHAATRTGRYGLYFETGQGADGTNGHGKGFDMVLHESRKYGFARALKREVRQAWVHVNDVAGFIGPEVFRTREQLVRCCLEDTLMGKLHGLAIGLDICSTLHMDVNLDDLDWCIDRIMPANPAYLMALPTKNDPMLSYLTTAFSDHVRVREKFGYKVNDAMWSFFQSLGVIDAQGRPTGHFGDPGWVYLQYRRRKGDARTDAAILAEGAAQREEVRARGVFLAEGRDGDPELDKRIRFLYEDSKQCIRTELPGDFVRRVAPAIELRTQSADRSDYILHPPTGEVLDTASSTRLRELAGDFDVQVVISDGLNALALTDEGHLEPYLESLARALASTGRRLASERIVVRQGRVRAGYRIGEALFGRLSDRESRRAILHIIGERPGSGHHAFSVYSTSVPVSTWAETGRVDHNLTRVVSGIADTALDPALAAMETVKLL